MIRINVVPRWAWGVGIAAALIAGLAYAGILTIRAVRADERTKVLDEGARLTSLVSARTDALIRQRDSLTLLVDQRDTIIIRRVTHARQEAAQPSPSGSDTAALITAVQSCRAQLDTLAGDCESFRAAARAAASSADSALAAKNDQIAGINQQLAAVRRADSVKAAHQIGRSKWKPIKTGICVGAIAGHLFQWSTR